jgi:hypothetical protein
MKNVVIDDSVAVRTRSPALATSDVSGIESLERVCPPANLVGIGVT